ncbi:MAG TPA: FlgD immunoglobulin-like domain containing protein [bacterium]|nr:FlgD immunoglobulin-like domain containing protein [bacterium]
MNRTRHIVILGAAALLLVWALAGEAQVGSLPVLCGEGQQLEVIALGMGNKSALNSPQIIYIPNPETVDSMLIQVVAKVPPEYTPPEEAFIVTPLEKHHLDTPTVITKGYGYHYEKMLKPAAFIKVYMEGDANPGYSCARAAVVYILRKSSEARFTTGKLVHQGLWWEAGDRPNTWSEIQTIPATFGPRDVEITCVITDKESSSRLALLRAEAGPRVIEKSIDDPNFGDEVLVETLLLKAVPGEVTEVKVTVSSPEDKGDSIFWSGMVLSTSCGEVDMGDAMEHGFPTLLSHDGARHTYKPGYFLGAAIDTEPDGHPGDKADGDDTIGIDDEDGVEFKSKFYQGQAGQMEITASAPGFLNVWFDWNGDGTWNQDGEHAVVDLALSTGVNPLSIDVPMTGLEELFSFCRFRFSSVPGLLASGPAPDGEVEDYLVPVYTPVEMSSFFAAAMDGAVVLQWETQSETSNLGFNVYRATEEGGIFSQINLRMIQGAGSSASAHRYRYVDETAEAGKVYYYQIVDIAADGQMQWHGPVMVEVAKPTANRLDQNSPNPFNATTRISYSIKQPGQVVLAIYNLQGQRVRTLVAKPHETGSYSAIWDGRDDAGHDLPTGAYLYLLKMPDAELSQRMTLIK